MVPLKLELKNFLSYGEMQAIDFSEHNLICLSGKNGHGKSAILDAITWAVWGQARKSGGNAKPDEGLLKLGQTKMLVLLDFKINEQFYRVRREYLKGSAGKSVANLEFSVQGDDGSFLPLTEKTIRQTQKKIDSTLKVDFETFVNSSFLRQGNANEFSKKSPRERKFLLTKILGFSLYDKMQQRALDLGKQKSIDYKALLVQEQKNQEQVSQLPELIEQKNKLWLQLEQNKADLEKVRVSKLDVDEKKVVINRQIEEAKKLVGERDEVEENLLLQGEKLLGFAKSWRENHRSILCANFRGDFEKELLQAQSDLEILEKQFFSKMQGNQKILRLKNLVENFDRLEKELAQAQIGLTLLGKDAVNPETLKQKIAKSKIGLGHLQKLGFSFSRRKLDLSHKLQKCENPADESLLDQVCPTCQQLVGEDVKNRLKLQKDHQQIFFRHQYNRLEWATPLLAEVLEKRRQDLECLEKAMSQQLLKEGRAQDLEKIIQNLEEQLLLLRKASESFDPAVLRQEFERLQQDQFKLEGVELRLEKAKKHLEALQQQKSQQLLAQQKQREQVIWRDRFAETRKILRGLTQSRKKIIRQLGDTDKIKSQYFALKSEWEGVVASLDSCEKLQTQLIKDFTTSEVMVQMREDLFLANEKIKIEIGTLSAEVADFEFLAEAFGKNGVQAFLIEDVIPEIEGATNQILDLISQTQARVFIEPLRDLKKGGVKESLDITISDINGVRDYEMFSGGEAFRIDFALRIGISQVIAKRCGTNLKTLIIDEGFGSLDEDGVNMMMNCIYKIADHFEKVIVVSHLPILKEMFPVHLHVCKDATGSKVEVEFRG